MAGSLGYASRLTFRADVGGTLGTPELLDAGSASSDAKLAELVSLVRGAKRIVVHTGAGISCAAGIPDFRGPQGVWTSQKKGLPLPSASVPFYLAAPTFTHQALLALQRAGKLSYLVSCNVDSLHLRGGFPRHLLAELHGNCFAERCSRCGLEFVRDFEQTTVGFKKTGRACGAPTRDQVLDWDDALPPAELKLAEQRSSEADLTITLGTSLQIHPACNLPLRTLRAGGRFVIVNLQKTPKDGKAHLLIRRRSDDVMRHLLTALSLTVPDYVRTDAVLVRHVQGNGSGGSGQLFTVHVQSRHGAKCPIPWCLSAQLRFPDGDGEVLTSKKGVKREREGAPAPAAAAAAAEDDGWIAAGPVSTPPPWTFKCRAFPGDDGELRSQLRLQIRLVLDPGCGGGEGGSGKRTPPMEYVARFGRGAGSEQLLHVETMRVSYAVAEGAGAAAAGAAGAA